MGPTEGSDGHRASIELAPTDLIAVLKGWRTYLDAGVPLVDAMVVSFDQGRGRLDSFCFGASSADLLQGALSQLPVKTSSTPTTKTQLHTELSPHLGIASPKLEVLIPLGGLIKLLPEFIDDGLLSSRQLTAHLLKDMTVYLQIGVSPDDFALLDKLTSSVIKRGGTLRASSRQTLDAISPFLAKRIVGQGSLGVQQSIKEAFDPRDVLM